MVEAGADNSGRTLIDDVFNDVKGDDTLLKFPPGRYMANELIIYGLSNFAMVGEDATLVPGPNYRDEVWLGGSNVEDVRIENFTIDNTKEGQGPEVDINTYGGLEVRNIHKAGRHDDDGTAFGIQVISENGDALIENVIAPDGGPAVGMYIQGNGPVTVRDCHIEGFSNNGLYASHCNAPVTVEGGTFKDNNISQVRLGCEGSTLTDAQLEVTRPVSGPDTDVVNMRGLRVADGAGPVTVKNCDISMRGGSGTGGIVNAYSGGSLEVYDTRIFVGREYTTPSSDGRLTGWGVFVDNHGDGTPEGRRTFRNVSITGGGRHMAGMLIRRSNNTVEGLCLNQSGERRHGIIFEDSANNAVTNSTIDVTGTPIRLENSSARKANISYEGSCPAPNLGGSESGSEAESSGHPVSEFQGEIRRVTASQPSPGEWNAVDFSRSYEEPIVISQPLSQEGPHPCHVRVGGVDSSGYRYALEEWAYLDGKHRTESTCFAAIDAASIDDTPFAAGTLRANHEFTRFDFGQRFDERPVVFAQPQTVNGTDPVVARLRNVTVRGAEVRVQEEERSDYGGYHRPERIGYLAAEPATGTLGDRPFEIDFTEERVDEDWYHIDFDRNYDDPSLLVAIQSANGPNTVSVRHTNLTGTGVDVFLEEERSGDQETGHRFETIGYAVFESA